MSDTAANLRHKIDGARELRSVVRTMKAMAASSIGQYENAVRSLDEYYRTVQLALAASFRQGSPQAAGSSKSRQHAAETTVAIVFGSDQGLVGQFNEMMVAFVGDTLKTFPERQVVWAVGERMASRLADTGLAPEKSFILPNAISAITLLIEQILLEVESRRTTAGLTQVYLFHNHPEPGALCLPQCQRLLPLDDSWQQDVASMPWPTGNLPQVIHADGRALLAFVREYLFVSLFRACAESLASENASRLAAMQRAEKNIDDILEGLKQSFYRLRQSSIDEELFDVVSGFEALSLAGNAPRIRG